MNGGIEVVLCTYNGERYIEGQLQSVLAQTMLPSLVSIWDDCSSDRTVSVVSEILNRQAPAGVAFRVNANEKNKGWVKNFSDALLASEQDIVFLCDQDDWWERDKVARCIDSLKHSGATLAFSDGQLVDSSGNALGATVLGRLGLRDGLIEEFNQAPLRFLLKQNFINGAATVIRRDAVLAALPVPEDVPLDYWMAIWSCLHGTVYCSNEQLYHYRQHDGNVIGANMKSVLEQVLIVWRNPLGPRRRELKRVSAIVARLSRHPVAGVELFVAKRQWLERLTSGSKLARLLNIGRSVLDGSYRRFGSPLAWLHDSFGVLRQ